jgi:predicted metalloprotease
MAGAYALRAQHQGFLQEGDVSEGVVIAMLSGDPAGLDEMAANAHGSGDDRVTSFMRGYIDGIGACMTL